jgi:hypothetical protein
LDLGLLIGRDHEFIAAHGLALPAALAELQHPAGFDYVLIY